MSGDMNLLTHKPVQRWW